MNVSTGSVAQPEFGRRLREIRLRSGLSQSELAEGVANPSYVSMLESGKRTPSLEIVLLLSRRLSVSPSELTGTDLTGAESEAGRRDDDYLSLQLRARSAMELGDAEGARDAFAQIYRRAAAGTDAYWMTSAGLSLESVLQSLGEDGARFELLEELERITRQQVSDVRLRVLTSLADVAWDTGRLRRAEQIIRDALDLLRTEGREGTTEHIRALGMLVVLRCDLGEVEGVDALVDLMIESATRVGRPVTIGWAHWSAAVGYAVIENVERAVAHLTRAEELADGFLNRGEWVWFCRSAASILLSAGASLARVRAYVEQAEGALRHHSQPGQRLRLSVVTARYELASGDPASAERRCVDLLASTDPQLTPVDRARVLELHARALATLERPEPAIEQLRAAAQAYEAMGAYRWASRAWREVDRLHRPR
ncbi:helix-turn-helix domain-containing protein [Plantactinospora sp. WMMB334]|uniref:helix-turn-helix domain-containing protein n=1 Tax=Plantactinospora sp. WMMB334 TaxID=3404119 RepID=UPI003B95E89B